MLVILLVTKDGEREREKGKILFNKKRKHY